MYTLIGTITWNDFYQSSLPPPSSFNIISVNSISTILLGTYIAEIMVKYFIRLSNYNHVFNQQPHYYRGVRMEIWLSSNSKPTVAANIPVKI